MPEMILLFHVLIPSLLSLFSFHLSIGHILKGFFDKLLYDVFLQCRLSSARPAFMTFILIISGDVLNYEYPHYGMEQILHIHVSYHFKTLVFNLRTTINVRIP
jgi:hypothetical protein